MSDGDDPSDAKKFILARRARFIAAAVASVGLACNNENTPPQPCLSVAPYSPDAAEPQVCLSPPLPPAEADAGPMVAVPPPDAGSDLAADGGPAPMPCLSPMPPARDAGVVKKGPVVPPQPCLSPPLPPKKTP